MERHRSQPYNPNIANGFFRAGYVETWGRGIEKICETCKKHGVPMPEYFNDTVARSFEKESELRILYWDFRKALDEKVKMQIEILLNEIVKSIKNKAERRNGYLLPLKCLFCYVEKSGMRDIMKMEQDQEQEYFCMLKEEYGNPCLSPKKFIFFCRKVLFLKAAGYYYENENSWMKNWQKRRFNIMQKWKIVWEELC